MTSCIALFMFRKNMKESQKCGALMKPCLQAIPYITGLFSYLNQKIYLFFLSQFELALPLLQLNKLEGRKAQDKQEVIKLLLMFLMVFSLSSHRLLVWQLTPYIMVNHITFNSTMTL